MAVGKIISAGGEIRWENRFGWLGIFFDRWKKSKFDGVRLGSLVVFFLGGGWVGASTPD